MIAFIKRGVNDLYNSFNNKKNEGFSARKLTAFTFVAFSGWIHLKHVNHDNAIEVLIIDGAIALLCLGIVTVSNIIEFKNGHKESANTENKSNEDTI